MKTTLFIVHLLCATTSVFGQTYENNVRVVCTCQVLEFMRIPPSQRNNMAYIIKPSCPLHKPMTVQTTEDFYFFKRPKKAKTPKTKGTHIIAPASLDWTPPSVIEPILSKIKEKQIKNEKYTVNLYSNALLGCDSFNFSRGGYFPCFHVWSKWPFEMVIRKWKQSSTAVQAMSTPSV